MSKKGELTLKQKLFVKEYLISNNSADACRKAGYQSKNNNWNRIGNANLNQKLVREAIDKELKIKLSTLDITSDYILTNLKDVVERCLTNTNVMEYNNYTKQWENSGTYKFDSQGAIRSLELLGKTLNMFNDKKDINLTIGYEEALRKVQDEDTY